MRILTRWALPVMLAAGLAQPARAGLHPAIPQEPRGITLVGRTTGPDPLGLVTFTVVDKWNGMALAGLTVWLDFSACGDVRVYSDAVGEGVRLTCATPIAAAETDAQGRVRFIVMGSGASGAASIGPCAAVYVAGQRFAPLIVSTFDLDGVGGVSAIDLSILGGDLVSGQYRSRSDYNSDGRLNANDLGLFGQALFGGGSVFSGTACAP